MFLNKLNDTQKDLFLELVYAAAMANGEFSDEERVVMQLYCTEMNKTFDAKKTNTNVYGLLIKLGAISDEQEKKIIVFELMCLIMSDFVYDEEEKEFMQRVSRALKIDEAYIDECSRLIKEYYQYQAKMKDFVFGK